MRQTLLDKDDRDFLKAEIKQHILMYLLILIISSIIVFGIVFILDNSNLNINPSLVYIILGLGYLGIMFYKLRPMTKELSHGIKYTTQGLITDKKESIKYLWSSNIGADLTRQPKMIEHFFTIDNQEVWIDRKYYNEFNIGEIIDIHFSVRTGKILKITKI